MTRTLIAAVLAAALLGATAAAQEDDGPQRHFHKAEILLKEGHVEAAAGILHEMILEWPDDENYTPRAYLLLGKCLTELEKHEAALELLRDGLKRFGESEKFHRAAKMLLDHVNRLLDAERTRRAARDEADARLEQFGRRLKEEGLEGEEFRKAFEKEREKILREMEHRHLKELYKEWAEQGVSEEEIEKRRARIEDGRRAAEQAWKLYEKMLEHYRERLPKAEAARRAAEEAKRRAEEEERRWRESRAADLERAREEFLKLAEHLGIPPEAAERLMEEHRPRQGPWDDRAEEVHRRLERVEQRLTALEERLNGLVEHLESDVLQDFHRAIDHLEKRIADLAERTGAGGEDDDGRHPRER